LNYLYDNQFPITIQEHFQNQKTNGKRQTPNVYDDIFSLDMIYAFLKGRDVWYATCGEISNYYDSFINSKINRIDDNLFILNYAGNYDNASLTLKMDASKIMYLKTGVTIHGIYKNDSWVFNNLKPGYYSIA
jgi:hypothetical protein